MSRVAIVGGNGQIADAAGDSPVRRTARRAVDLLRRGIVSTD